GAAGAASLLFVYSLACAHHRVAYDSKLPQVGRERQFKGVLDAYRKILKSEGVVGLYHGFSISCLGAVVYRGLYFGLYDSLKPTLLSGSLSDSFLASFLLGWGTTIGASMASYPIDTVMRHRMMMHYGAFKYESSAHAFSELIKKEGLKALYKGATANVL